MAYPSTAKGIGGHHTPKSKTTTWLTPRYIVDALGPFTYDPCAAPEPRPWPTAKYMTSLPENGLTMDWAQHYVWMNPPYGPPAVVDPWLEKMAMHGRDGWNGIALIFARTETEAFFRYVWREPAAYAALFLLGRLFFCDARGVAAKHNSGAPSVLIAYGQYAMERLRMAQQAGVIEGALVDLQKHRNIA